MLAQPRVIGCALDREIEREFDPVSRGGVAQPAEIVKRAEGRMDRVVPTLGAADRVGTSRIIRSGMGRIVATLAVRPPDRVDRRKVEHVETHRADRRQAADHVVEGPMPPNVAGLRAGKQLVPAREPGGAPLGLDREVDRMAVRLRSNSCARYQIRRCRSEE